MDNCILYEGFENICTTDVSANCTDVVARHAPSLTCRHTVAAALPECTFQGWPHTRAICQQNTCETESRRSLCQSVRPKGEPVYTSTLLEKHV